MNAREVIHRCILMFGIALIISSSASSNQCQTASELRVDSSSGSRGPEPQQASHHATRIELTPTFRIKDTSYLSAYQDVVSILNHENACTDFFGSPAAALEVFDQLAARMTKTYTTSSIGIRMSGEYRLMRNYDSPLRYRLFNKAEVNLRGAFFHKHTFDNEPRTPPVGSFSPNTREARALMLLHEVGHLIEVKPGHWLLPDDGDNEALSLKNTRTIEKHCEETIRGLAKSTPASQPSHNSKRQP